MWEAWAEEAGRWNRKTQTGDLVIFETLRPGGALIFSIVKPAARAPEDRGLLINIVALLDEIACGCRQRRPTSDSGGRRQQILRGRPAQPEHQRCGPPQSRGPAGTLPLMRAIVNTAPQSLKEAQNDEWRHGPGECAALLRDADKATGGGDADMRADFEECRAYWMPEFPNLSDRTRSIVVLSFSMLVRPFITRAHGPIGFSANTNITPEDIFSKER